MERPLLLPLCALILGLCTAWFLPFSHPPTVPLVHLLFAVAALSLFRQSTMLFASAVMALLFAWGFWSLQPLLHPKSADWQLSRLADGSELTMEGVVARRPENRDQGGRLTVQLDRVFLSGRLVPVGGRVLVTIGSGMPACTTGDRVRFMARLKEPRPYGLPGEFDYRRFLALRGIVVTAFVAEGKDIVLLEAAARPSLERRIDLLADRIGKGIDGALPQPEAGILRALLIGDMGKVPQGIKDAYSRTGVNHILSISGFHVGIVALMLVQLLFAVCRLIPFLLLHGWVRRGLGVTVLPVILFYLLLSGSAPATVRSVVMLAAYGLALLLERETDPINALLLAALVILGLEPAALFDLSFQFSFLALWGIIVLTPLFMRPWSGPGKGVCYRLLQLLMASAAATLATLLPVAYYFHQASATGLLSNFFIVPLMGYGAVLAGFVALPLLVAYPPLALPFLHLAGFMIHLSNWFIGYLDRLPLLPRFAPDRWQLGLFFLAMVAVTFIKRPGWRIGTTGGLLAAILAAALLPGIRPVGVFSMMFLSVGQGESTLLTFPDGKTMLIDGGGSFRNDSYDVGERLVAPALWELGVRNIDYLVLSHPHPDHLNGLLFIARHFHISEFWEGESVGADERYLALKQLLGERGVRCRVKNSTDSPTNIGGVRVEALSSAGTTAGARDLNDASLILRFTEGPFSLLMTGDAGQEVQRRLLAKPGQVRCSVLKVPHHGSRLTNDPDFFTAAAPQVAVVSVGYDNRFRFPAPETVANLQQSGAAVYRTDLHGTIMIEHRGQEAGFRISMPYGHFN